MFDLLQKAIRRYMPMRGLEIFSYRGLTVGMQVNFSRTQGLGSEWREYLGDRYKVEAIHVTRRTIMQGLDEKTGNYKPDHIKVEVSSVEHPEFRHSVGILHFSDYLLLTNLQLA